MGLARDLDAVHTLTTWPHKLMVDKVGLRSLFIMIDLSYW
jgi:hypothetical protein